MLYLLLFYIIILFHNVIFCIDKNDYDNAQKYYNQAVTCNNNYDYVCSINYYNEAINLVYDFPQAHQNLGGNYDAIGDYEKSLHHHKVSLSLSQDDTFRAGALSNIAFVENRIMTKSATYNESKVHYIIGLMEDALAIAPGHLNTLRNLGLMYSSIGSYQKSLQTFINLLYYHPNNGLAFLNIGNYYFRLNDFASSTYFYRKSTENAANIYDKISGMNNVAQSFRERAAYAKSISSFKRTLNFIDENKDKMTVPEKDALTTYTMINSYAVKLISCDWHSLEMYEFYLSKFISQSIAFNAQTVARTTFDELFGDDFNYLDPYTFTLFRFTSLQAELLTSNLACEQIGYKLINEWSSNLLNNYVHGRKMTKGGLLNVGYLSYDWRDHPMGRLTKWLVTHHNTSRFNTTLISYGPNDKSDIRNFVEANSNFVDIFLEKNDFTATHIVHNMNLDILIDITLHTFNGRVHIPASKPALIVINYLGFPGTSGCKGFDYIMVHSNLVSPETAKQTVSEKIIYLPDLYQSNYMPRDRDISRCIKPSDCRRRLNIEHHSGPVFCSFNAFKKLEPFVFSTWMNILRRTPNAILLLLASDTSDKVIDDNIKIQALLHGISSNRLIFLPHLPWTQHLERVGACDLVLDTFVYGAHTTSTDMLWMWVPILALEAWGHGRIPSRVASSIVGSLLSNDNNPKRKHCESVLKSTILTTVYEYEDAAVRIGSVQNYTNSVHNAIGQLVLHRPTFDYNAMEVSIELAYQAAWEAYALNNIDNNTIGHNRTMSHIIITKRSETKQLKDSMSIALRETSTSTTSNTNMGQKNKRIKYFDDESFEGCTDIKGDDFFELAIQTYSGDKVLSGLLLFCLQTKPFTLLKALDKTIRELDDNTKCEKISYLFSLLSTQLYTTSTDYLYLYTTTSQRKTYNDSKYSDAYLEILQPLMKQLKEAALSGYILSPEVVKNMERELFSYSSESVRTMINEGIGFSTHILLEYGVCSYGIGDVNLGLSLHLSSFINNGGGDTNTELSISIMKNLGLMLQKTTFTDIGFLIINEAILKLQMSSSLQCTSNDIGPTTESTKIRVVFYCNEYGNDWWTNFGPSSVFGPNATGAGGSEESIIYITRELAFIGYDVYVYANPLANDIGTVSIGSGFLTWQHHSCFNVAQPIDVFVSWRYAASIMLGLNAKQRFLWIHDLIDHYVFPRSFWDKVDGIFVQSEFHKQFVLGLQDTSDNDNVFIIPNGVYMSNDCNGPNHNDLFVYGSSPSRGLEQVLKVWPHIKRHIPTATLEVYYGFTNNVDKQLGLQLGSSYAKWKAELLSLLEQEGIVYMRAVDHNTLMKAYARAGFLLYPTRFQETGCITVMKAMACGSIPVTSRLIPSVLYNLTKDFDFGPDNVLNTTIALNDASYHQWIDEDWLPSVLRLSTYSYEEIKNIRKKMKEYGRSMSWEVSAKTMSSYFI